MLLFLVELLETQKRVSSARRCLYHFSEHELDDIGVIFSEILFLRQH
ncbi:hypothetical protein MKK84_17565 [Methylobacterium sp. E-065]|nr:hypothetical protein [Methylobacterium sp. E-065]MCJ2019226.1 hypothetical protein [Methylobacterium sp. E-065]